MSKKEDKPIVSIEIETLCDGPISLTIDQARSVYDELRSIFEPSDMLPLAKWVAVAAKVEEKRQKEGDK